MRDKFFKMMTEFKVAEYYYQAVARATAIAKVIISGVCLLGTSGIAAMLGKLGAVPWFCSVILVVCQVITVLQPVFPFDRRNIAANYINGGVRALLADVEQTWNQIDIDLIGEEEICGLITKYRQQYDRIEMTFADPSTFTLSEHGIGKKLFDIAVARAHDYYYPKKKEDKDKKK